MTPVRKTRDPRANTDPSPIVSGSSLQKIKITKIMDQSGPHQYYGASLKFHRTMPSKKYFTAQELAMGTAYRSQKSRAKGRGIGWEFSFETWCDWWLTDDRWSNRGLRKGQFSMCRYSDKGPYSPSNVYPGTPLQNAADKPPAVRTAAAKKSWSNPNRFNPLKVRGDGHPKSKAILTPAGRFGSASLAAEHFGISRQHAARKARENVDGWSLAA